MYATGVILMLKRSSTQASTTNNLLFTRHDLTSTVATEPGQSRSTALHQDGIRANASAFSALKAVAMRRFDLWDVRSEMSKPAVLRVPLIAGPPILGLVRTSWSIMGCTTFAEGRRPPPAQFTWSFPTCVTLKSPFPWRCALMNQNVQILQTT